MHEHGKGDQLTMTTYWVKLLLLSGHLIFHNFSNHVLSSFIVSFGKKKSYMLLALKFSLLYFLRNFIMQLGSILRIFTKLDKSKK